MEYTGYHGTHRDAADSICRDENIEFSSSDTEWLGKGAYFFVNKEDAEWWCQTRRYGEKSIVTVDLVFEEYIDLVHRYSDQYIFSEFCKRVKTELLKRKKYYNKKNLMAVALKKLILQIESKKGTKVQAILAQFIENRPFFNSFDTKDSQRFNCVIAQTQICIRSKDCITNYRIEE